MWAERLWICCCCRIILDSLRTCSPSWAARLHLHGHTKKTNPGPPASGQSSPKWTAMGQRCRKSLYSKVRAWRKASTKPNQTVSCVFKTLFMCSRLHKTAGELPAIRRGFRRAGVSEEGQHSSDPAHQSGLWGVVSVCVLNRTTTTEEVHINDAAGTQLDWHNPSDLRSDYVIFDTGSLLRHNPDFCNEVV